jgi:hypothetical protein
MQLTHHFGAGFAGIFKIKQHWVQMPCVISRFSTVIVDSPVRSTVNIVFLRTLMRSERERQANVYRLIKLDKLID